jgi:hypothetical protein
MLPQSYTCQLPYQYATSHLYLPCQHRTTTCHLPCHPFILPHVILLVMLHGICTVHVSSFGAAMCPSLFGVLLVGQNLQNIITSSYDVCLRPFKLHWKSLIELYVMKSFSSVFESINFLVFRILLDHLLSLCNL